MSVSRLKSLVRLAFRKRLSRGMDIVNKIIYQNPDALSLSTSTILQMADFSASTWLLKEELNETASDVESDSQSAQPTFARVRGTTCTQCNAFLGRAIIVAVFVLNNLIWYIAFHQIQQSRESLEATKLARNDLTYCKTLCWRLRYGLTTYSSGAWRVRQS